MQTISKRSRARSGDREFPRSTTSSFQLNQIAAACTLMVLVAGSADAQQAPAANTAASDVTPQTVIVTGIRRSLEDSLSVKRNSDSIVEVVSAEDTGKLPDSSIAEALARLPGVTGQRGSDGRVTEISIRGLSPEFSGALLNGREMVSSTDRRTVEYDQFPSELISQAIVYKTPDAALVGQGLSGTVDLRTRRPLDTRGREVTVNLRGDKNSQGALIPGVTDPVGSRFSASFVDQFANNTIGVALGFARLDQNTELRWTEEPGWADAIPWGVGITGVPPQLHPGNGSTNALLPMYWDAKESSKKNVRNGLMGVFEYKPSRDLHSTVDMYYSKFDTHEVTGLFNAQMWGDWGGNTTNLSNVGLTQIGQNTFATTATADNLQYNVGNADDRRTDKTGAIGWNTEFTIADKWTATSDLSYSHIRHDESYKELYGASYNNSTHTWAPGAFSWNVPASGLGNETYTPLNNSLTNNISLGDPLGWVANQPRYTGTIRAPNYDDTIKSLRLSTKHEMDGIFKDFVAGFNFSQRDKLIVNEEHRLLLNTDSAGNDIRDIPSYALGTPYNLSGIGISSMANINIQSLINSGFVTPQTLFSQMPAENSGVHEKIETLYGKLDIDTQWGNIPIRGNVGLQAVHTKQESEGVEYLGNDVTPDINLLFNRTGGASYTNLLPSLNLIADLPENWVTRFGVARTMARPNVIDMRAGTSTPTVNTAAGPSQGQWSTAYAGNPELRPWMANAFDIEVEKYFSKRSYASVALFYKDLTSFVYTQNLPRDNSGIPVTGLPPGVTPQQFGPYQQAVNGSGGSLRGIEVSAALEGKMLAPVLNNFGVIASASKLGSNVAYPPGSFTFVPGKGVGAPVPAQPGSQVPLNGLSGTSFNATFYYENEGFTARISQRYRSAFTATVPNIYLLSETTQQEADRVTDLQLEYTFGDGMYKGLSFLFQVNNLLNKDTQDLTTTSTNAPDTTMLAPHRTFEFGREILAGVNYKF
ncbi:MAG TPA: TonB-dependent receptor [Burkholderiaceae bacterium]|jgi:TonB-dependent receptor